MLLAFNIDYILKILYSFQPMVKNHKFPGEHSQDTVKFHDISFTTRGTPNDVELHTSVCYKCPCKKEIRSNLVSIKNL